VETGGGELESLQSRWYSTRPCRLLSRDSWLFLFLFPLNVGLNM